MGLCYSSSWMARPDGSFNQENDIGSTRLSVGRARGRAENKLKDLGSYLPFYKAVLEKDWNEARKFLDEDPSALTAKITIASETALHIAVGTEREPKDVEFVEKLIRRMSPEDLALTDQNGETALSVAAVIGNIHTAKLLVNKNPDLPNISGKFGFPIHKAAEYGEEDMIWYLIEVTKEDIESSPFVGESGAKLLVEVICAGFFGIALYLVDRFPEMATTEVQGVGSPLTMRARNSTAFPSGYVTRWRQLFYKPVRFLLQLRKRRKRQHNALELVKSLCAEILELDDAKAFSLLQQPILIAARLGTHEIIEMIVKAFPPAIWATDEENHNIFQLAVLHRRENVFNLIYRMSDNYKHLITRYVDHPHDNNILHLAGKLPSSDRLNLVSGAALQVQRELQWFKEVKKLMQPSHVEAINKEGKTPWMIFRESHQQLMKDGEAWMKTTATACTVASTLIATVAFNAGIRVPGGNDRNDGHPVLYSQTAFGVFAVADAISLFSSVTCILMFLSILTSRYSEDDFLIVLPSGLIVGLCMLFISITSMMIAFSSAIYLVFGHVRAMIVIIAGSVLVLPVTLSVLLPPLHRIIFKSKFIGHHTSNNQGASILH